MQQTHLLQRFKQSIERMLSKPTTLLNPLEAYQLWAENYDDADGNALLFAEGRAVQRYLGASLLQNKDVLDAGCGTGRNLQMLQEYHPRMIAATDLSPNMLDKARTKIDGSTPTSLHVARVEQLPFSDASFDFVLCTLVLGHVEKLISAISQLSRVLRHGGTMMITDFHPFGQLLGWHRTFRGGKDHQQRFYAVKYYAHLYSEYFDSFKQTGLELIRMEEPTIDESLIRFYEKAGRTDIYQRYKGYPMLLIFEVRKK